MIFPGRRFHISGVCGSRNSSCDDFVGFVSVQPPRAFVPQEDSSGEILGNYRILGRRIENVGNEIHRGLRIADDGRIEEFFLLRRNAWLFCVVRSFPRSRRRAWLISKSRWGRPANREMSKGALLLREAPVGLFSWLYNLKLGDV